MATDKKQGPAASGAPDERQAMTPPATPSDDFVLNRTRMASLLVTAAIALVLALLMLIFVLQNGDRQRLEFLWLDFTMPTGVAMLLAAIIGGLIVASLGLGRVAQLRLAARRHRHADHRAG